jgi:hypothetical protein
MDIAFVSAEGRGETDRLLAEAAADMARGGIRTAGIVKHLPYAGAYENGCDAKVQVLPDGPVIKITQDLGAGSDACRLDPAAIAGAVAAVESSALERADLFILNKFGPEEAAGRGFCAVIGRALELGMPVLVGVGRGARADFDSFTDGLATPVPANAAAIADWCRKAIASRGAYASSSASQ